MAKFSWKRYVVRELTHILLYPFIFALITIFASYFGFIKADATEVINWIAILTVIASLITFAISYWFARRRKKLF